MIAGQLLPVVIYRQCWWAACDKGWWCKWCSWNRWWLLAG